MIKNITYSFLLLCLSIFVSGVVWTTLKQYEHERIMHAVVHKVQIERMYDKDVHDIQFD